MIKMRTKFFLLICPFVLLFFWGCAQSSSLNGVYVGAELYTTPFNGMQVNHIAISFRSNGTLNDDLSSADWKTKTTGSYSVRNGEVELQFSDGREKRKYKLAANGRLESTSSIRYALRKVKPVTSLPAGSYERRSASSTGGMGTGSPNVGVFSSDYLTFDGKGNFSTDHSGIVGIGGDANGGTIGGRSSQTSAAAGTYKLAEGEIRLTYGNGTVKKHSFFYSPPGEEDLIVIDGAFYFREEGKNSGTERTETKQREIPDTGDSEEASASAADLLGRLRTKYGGAGIDRIRTIREVATLTGGLEATFLMDVTDGKVRAEVRQNGKLVLVKQLTGNNGWQWMNGKKTTLGENEKTELKLALYQGIVGLHKSLNQYFRSGTVTRSGGDYTVSFSVDGKKVVYLIGSDLTLKGNGYSVTGTPNFVVYRDFVQRDGIVYPMVSESSDGNNTIVSRTTSLQLNPVLTDASWQLPE